MARKDGVKVGICPSCGSDDTFINVMTHGNFLDNGKVAVFGECAACGFKDNRLIGDADDLDILVDIAKDSFCKVVYKDGERVDGTPTVGDIAEDIAWLLQFVCSKSDCSRCIIHGGNDLTPANYKKGDRFSEGSLAVDGNLHLDCGCQSVSNLKERLHRHYPSWV